jgi:hypothetical protein
VATVTEIAAVGQLEDRRQPTTTLEGWRRFVDADPPEFTLLADDEWASLGEDERTAYNEARVAHHSELVVVTTSAIEAITHQGRLLTLLNQREIGARRGLIISGGAATGKTTAIKQLGRFHELRTRARFPGDESRIPVVYVTAPAERVAPQVGDGVRTVSGASHAQSADERDRYFRCRVPGAHRCPYRHRGGR